MINVPRKLNNVCSFVVKKRRFHFVEYTSTCSAANNEVLMTDNAIVYIVKGRKEITIDKTTHVVNAGELFMLPKGKYVMSEYLPHDGEFKSIMLFFNNYHITDILNTITDKIASGIGREQSWDLNILKATAKSRDIFMYLTQIDWHDDNGFGKELLDIKIKELILTLLSDKESRNKTLKFLNKISASEKKSFTAVINDNLYNTVSVSTLARMCHMSASTFKREFTKEFNAAPMQWINEKRLEKAMLLVRNTQAQVIDIAYECGFENYTHFSRRFKAQYGRPAKDFRAKER